MKTRVSGARTRAPLLKSVSPAMSDRQRLTMIREAMRAIRERADLEPRLKARGLAPLEAAERRLLRRLSETPF
ncbi:MAG: hypothetical protein H0Z37_10540 [Firmicutes bacterium]|nr:hypothetical protein [Bacillota bacterium]